METIKINSTQELEKFSKSLIEDIAKSKNERINVGLPGGRSVKPILAAISSLDDIILARIYFYLIDERIDSDSNADMIIEELLNSLLDAGRISDEQICFPIFTGNLNEDLKIYESKLDNFDIIFAGSGEDGHFASIFPEYTEYNSKNYIEVVENSPKPPARRITMTHLCFDNYGRNATYVALFLGDGKRDAYESFKKTDDFTKTPIVYLKKFDKLFVVTDIDL